ncbi:putative zinc-binding metallopeptidase [Mycobacterium sp.]
MSSYAATHPTEDWAETFAYYLQTPLIDSSARPGWPGR